MQTRRVTNPICSKREMEIKNLKEKFENQLQILCKHSILDKLKRTLISNVNILNIKYKHDLQ
jgi:hypothetical protein